MPAMHSGWAVGRPGPIDAELLERVRRETPAPGPGKLPLRVKASGVCRTDLYFAEEDLARHRRSTIPGHEIVGRVEAVGERVSLFASGTGQAGHGCAALAGVAGTAGPARRTSAWTLPTRDGTRTAASPRRPWFLIHSPTGCRRAGTRSCSRLSCAQASSASGRFSAAHCPGVGGSVVHAEVLSAPSCAPAHGALSA